MPGIKSFIRSCSAFRESVGENSSSKPLHSTVVDRTLQLRPHFEGVSCGLREFVIFGRSECTSLGIVSDVPNDETTPSTDAQAPDGDHEAFARLRMEGARFKQTQLPIDAMVELQRYQRLILKAAELEWRKANPDQDLPVDFATGSKLVLKELEPGSTISVLDLAVTSQYDPYYEAGREEFEREVEKIEQWLAADAAQRADFDLLTLPLLDEPEFAELGSSAQPGDEFTIASPTTQTPIAVTEELRVDAIAPLAEQRALLISPPVLAVPPRSVPGEVAGKLFLVNTESLSFEMRSLRYGKIRGRYRNADLTADLREVLDNTAKAPVVRVTGELRYRNDMLKEVLNVTAVQLLATDGEPWSARFIALATLDDGWDPENPNSKAVQFAAVDAAREILGECAAASRALPGIFPMEDGGVQLEWASAEYVTSIEISPDLEFELFDLEVATKTVVEEQTTDLSDAKAFVARTAR